MIRLEESPENAKPAVRGKPAPLGWGRVAACIVLLLCLVYLFYSNSQFKKEMRSEIARLEDRVRALKESGDLTEASLSGQILGLEDELNAVRASSAAR
jgi:hypothetical protein